MVLLHVAVLQNTFATGDTNLSVKIQRFKNAILGSWVMIRIVTNLSIYSSNIVLQPQQTAWILHPTPKESSVF